MTDPLDAYWQRFLASLPEESPYRRRSYTAEAWGDAPEMAQELADLIAAGTKTATCSCVWEWEAAGKPLPEAGYLTLVLDGAGAPVCIIETLHVEVKPYHQVDAAFAYQEGEGDRSLAYWRDAHWRYFSRALAALGRQPTQDMPLVCEQFRLIYQE